MVVTWNDAKIPHDENGDEINLYNILGVPMDATSRQIKIAFRKKALGMHPDHLLACAGHPLQRGQRSSPVQLRYVTSRQVDSTQVNSPALATHIKEGEIYIPVLKALDVMTDSRRRVGRRMEALLVEVAMCVHTAHTAAAGDIR